LGGQVYKQTPSKVTPEHLHYPSKAKLKVGQRQTALAISKRELSGQVCTHKFPIKKVEGAQVEVAMGPPN